MQNRNPFIVILLSIVTLGIYSLVWLIKTKNEMNAKGAQIPTAWLIIVPFVNYYWLWKYSEGVEKVTNDQMSTVIAFLLLFFLEFIGMAIIQDKFNNIDA